MQGLKYSQFSCADALHDHFILPSTIKSPPPSSPPPYPLFPPPLHGSFSHSSDCSLTSSSSFPVTVVWISSLVARGLQADTTPPYMNGMCMMSTGNGFLFMQYHAVGNKYLYPNQNVLSGAQQEAVQHAQGLEKDKERTSPTCNSELKVDSIFVPLSYYFKV